VVPEVEDLGKKEQAGTLEQEAKELRQQQDQEEQRERRPKNVV
jgi:hypothetical protein